MSRKKSVTAIFDNLIDGDSEIITVMYGATVQPEELKEVMLYLEEHHGDVEVETIEGNQEIYSYIIAVE